MKVSVSMADKKKSNGGRKVTHIHVERAGNGFTVDHRLEPKKERRGAQMVEAYEPSPKPNVFQDKDAMLAHVGQLAGQMGGNESGAPDADGDGDNDAPTQAA